METQGRVKAKPEKAPTLKSQLTLEAALENYLQDFADISQMTLSSALALSQEPEAALRKFLDRLISHAFEKILRHRTPPCHARACSKANVLNFSSSIMQVSESERPSNRSEKLKQEPANSIFTICQPLL
ncbi:MAG: hypothetical protein R2865_14255 [Deinococcales bacterium]